MWRYEKRLQYPVKISQTNPKLAQFIISQYGGPECKNIHTCREPLFYKGLRRLCVVVEPDLILRPVYDDLPEDAADRHSFDVIVHIRIG